MEDYNDKNNHNKNTNQQLHSRGRLCLYRISKELLIEVRLNLVAM